jgi:hypothetical protein
MSFRAPYPAAAAAKSPSSTMPTSEAEFSAKLVADIKHQSVYAYKTTDRVRSGVPDIYVSGGNWIEDKFFKIDIAKSTGKNCRKFISPLQQRFLDRAHKNGDGAFVGLFFLDKPSYFVLIEWKNFKHVKVWTTTDIRLLGDPWKEGPLPFVEDTFKNSFPRKINRVRLDYKWGKWLGSNNANFQADDTMQNRKRAVLFPPPRGTK